MDTLFAQIRDSVEREADQLISRAARVAEREKEHARDDAETILTEYRAQARLAAEAGEERARAHRIIETRKRELSQRQQFVERIFNLVREKIRSYPRDEQYTAWIRRLVEQGREPFGTEPVTVYCSAQDRSCVQQALRETGLKLGDEPVDIAGGVILKSEDGRVTVDCSAEAELQRAQDEMRDEVLRRLHSDENPSAE